MRRHAITVSAVIGGYALLVAVLYWRVWSRGQMSGWDCAVEYWPDLIFQVHSIGRGHWPTWNPYALGGYPYWADPQTGLYHPSSWLCWLGAAIGGTGPWLIQMKVFVNLLAGLCGMHLWTHARTRSHAAAAVAALTFVVGSPLLVMKNSAIMWPLLYAPWALWALERFVERPSLRRGAALAGATWLVAGAGSPPGTFYVAIVVVARAVFLVLAEPERRRWLLRAWRGLAVFAVLTGLLLAAIYLPAADVSSESQRAERGLGYVLQQPLTWHELDELAAPSLDTNWMHDLYMGSLAVIGGLWLAVCARRGRVRAEVLFWIGVVVLGLLLALGKSGHVLPFLAEHAPGFGLFRIAYRYKLVSGIAAAVLAGDAVAALGRGEAPPWGRIAWSALAAAWLGLALWAGAKTTAWLLGLGVLAAATALAWLAQKKRLAAIAAVLVPALLFADLWHAGAAKLAILQRRPQPSKDLATAAAMTGTEGEWRYHVGNPSSPYGGRIPYHVAFLAGRRELSGYTDPVQTLRHVELTKRAKGDPAFLRHFNVKYFAGHKKPPPGTSVAPGIIAADDVAPIARWYGGVEVVKEQQILDRLAAIAPSQKRVAYVEAPLALEVGGAPPEPVAATLVRYDDDEVVVDVDAPAPGVVVLAEAWAPGWVAEVDGHAARVFRADYYLRAVQVPAGSSRIVFRYDPPGHTALPLLFLLGLVAMGVLTFTRLSEKLDRAAEGGDREVGGPQRE